MAIESWMTPDRAEQEVTGTRPGVVKRVTTTVDADAIRARLEANRAAPYVSTETQRIPGPTGQGLDVPVALGALPWQTWLAAQGAYDSTGASLVSGYLDEYGNQQAAPQALADGTTLVPNIDTSAPAYLKGLKDAEAQRAEAQGVVGRVFGETFRIMPKGSDPNVPHILTAEYYTYTGVSAENARSQFYELPLEIQQNFKSTAYQMGRYRGEKSPEALYEELMQASRLRVAQGKFDAPEEIYREFVLNGTLPMPLTEEELAAAEGGGGGGGGGGGFGGGGGGGTVQLSTPQQARFYIEQAYKSLLGRAPSEEEIAKFVEVLREAELNNPVTVEAVDGVMAQTGGYDPQILAAEMAKGEEEYRRRGAYEYYNMFMDLLGGGG